MGAAVSRWIKRAKMSSKQLAIELKINKECVDAMKRERDAKHTVLTVAPSVVIKHKDDDVAKLQAIAAEQRAAVRKYFERVAHSEPLLRRLRVELPNIGISYQLPVVCLPAEGRLTIW